jgi:hypothetical protein
MAEEANSACQSLAIESDKLAQMVAEFVVSRAEPSEAGRWRDAA